MFIRAFVLEQKCTNNWGEQAVFWGGTEPEKHFNGPWPVHIFCLGGTSSD